MERIKYGLSLLPAWMLSIITLVVIFWLTLAPQPLGEDPPSFFPGADKLAHGIMFGGFTAMMLLDWQRKHGWKAVWWNRAIVCAFLASLVGILIEFAQANMSLGRSFEYEDIIADVCGAFIFAIIWEFLQKSWIHNKT